MKMHRLPLLTALLLLLTLPGFAAEKLKLSKSSRVILVGGNLGSRMTHYGHFETEMHIRYPELQLYIRNMCDGGHTAGFRPHSASKQHFAFPGAEKFNPGKKNAAGIGHNEPDDQWISRHKADIVIGFFGYVESFRGQAGVDNFKGELEGFIKHTLSQKYNGATAPQLALVSPIAFQDLSAKFDYPNGQKENLNLGLYTNIMKEICAKNNVLFVDSFTPSTDWYTSGEQLTSDGSQLNDRGYQQFSKLLADGLFGQSSAKAESNRKQIYAAVQEKNWFWTNDFKIPNGVHVYGRRYKPFGPANYPDEIKKIREMTEIRDQAIWAAVQGKQLDIASLDKNTHKLPVVKTNFRNASKAKYLSPEESHKKIAVADGYKIELFASEKEFPHLSNPVQMAFDNKGRLWVAVMPSYPHWKPGDPKPNDKLLILEDTNGDGKADKETVFADGLTLPIGFEFAPEGVYLSQGTNLVLLKDTNGDDKADESELILSGFDDHDTHHNIGAFCADPSGAFYMGEGVFLNTNVETSYGTVRGTNGGFYRFNPQRRRLERTTQVSIPNPWGIACDDWGQMFFLHTSGPSFCWMTPTRIKNSYGHNMRTKDLLTEQRVRPTSGLEFISSRHFPDEVQGDVLLCNNIGFLGAKQHKIIEEGTGYTTKFRHDLFKSSDSNFRPVDMEFAPDGSLYLVDWHNMLIGHMQHNARDPYRDHNHGRVYRVTYPGRPLVKPAQVDGAPLFTLLDNLKLPEYRTRYRSRREIREHKETEVLPAVTKWAADLDKGAPRYEHHVLEALWVTWAMNRVDPVLLERCLNSKDHKVRAAATNVLHYTGHQIPNQAELLMKAAKDPHGRVKLEAISAASWIGKENGLKVLEAVISTKTSTKKEEPKAAGGNNEAVVKGTVIRYKSPALKSNKVTSIMARVSGTINIMEVEVISGGKNIARAAKASQSSFYNGTMKADKLIDGSKKTMGHTKDGDRKPWFKLEFSSPVQIDEVIIHNRSGYESRFNNAQVSFYSGKKSFLTMNTKIKGGKSGGSVIAGLDQWTSDAYKTAQANLNGEVLAEPPPAPVKTHLKGAERELYIKGREIYEREGHCTTCHQPNGKGLESSGFPPLNGTKWILGDEERLIKLTLKGMMGPIAVKGKKYPGLVPMTPFGGLLDDNDMAAVLTYVRNSFGNKAPAVSPAKVKEVRAKVKTKAGFYSPDELLQMHPHK